MRAPFWSRADFSWRRSSSPSRRTPTRRRRIPRARSSMTCVKKVKQPGADFAALARSVVRRHGVRRAGRRARLAVRAGPADRNPQPGRRACKGRDSPSRSGSTTAGISSSCWIPKRPDTRPLAEVRDALVQRIRAERAEANRRAYMAELLKQTPPVVNEIALSKLLDAKSDTPPTR